MNHKTKTWFIIGGILLGFVCFGVYTVNHSPRESVTVIDFLKIASYLQDGDILCRLGNRFWSVAIRDMSPVDQRFSHLGIVRIREGNISIIHAEAWGNDGEDCVKEVPLEKFLHVAQSIGIYRANFTEGSVLSDYATEYKGQPFDWNFDLDDESKIYCTELLYIIVKRTVPEITLKAVYVGIIGKEIIPLDAISNSGDFEEIHVVFPQNRNL
jgi:hypothetical protein